MSTGDLEAAVCSRQRRRNSRLAGTVCKGERRAAALRAAPRRGKGVPYAARGRKVDRYMRPPASPSPRSLNETEPKRVTSPVCIGERARR